MDLSIVIPAYNERESLPVLLQEICQVMQGLNLAFEVIVVDDGSSDGTFELLEQLKPQMPWLRAISFRRNYGKSAALSEGFKIARGAVVITMDADLQDDPKEIPNLLKKLDEGYDLVSGWKKRRHDPLNKVIPSRIFNFVTARVTGIPLHDFNCGLKAYRRDVIKSIHVYGELHRFLPVLAQWQGFRVGEIPVRHRPRKYGRTKFGVSRFFNGFFDLITVLFITRYKTSPLHIFGMFGLLSFLLGFTTELYLTILWFMGHSIRNRPLFFLGILLIIVGVQFIVFGLIGEMISAGFAEKTEYSIKKKLD
ncbi:MAG: glycosyltransferase [Calditrichaeota bacterium]|nr:MAG: glycosyltransferase [Calditrichota bacterium]